MVYSTLVMALYIIGRSFSFVYILMIIVKLAF